MLDPTESSRPLPSSPSARAPNPESRFAGRADPAPTAPPRAPTPRPPAERAASTAARGSTPASPTVSTVDTFHLYAGVAAALWRRADASGFFWNLRLHLWHATYSCSSVDLVSAKALEREIRQFARTQAPEKGWVLRIDRDFGRGAVAPFEEPPQRLTPAIVIRMDLGDLFRRGGILYDPRLVDHNNRLSTQVPKECWLQARSLVLQQLKAFTPRPSIVVRIDRAFWAIYLLKKAIGPWDVDYGRKDLGDAIASRLHTGYAVGPERILDATIYMNAKHQPSLDITVFWSEPDRLYEVEDLVGRGRPRRATLPAREGGGRPDTLLAMVTETLPFGWQLEDLEVPEWVKEVLAGTNGIPPPSLLEPEKDVLRAMAYAGYGSMDAVRVVMDSRFSIGRRRQADPREVQSIRQCFRNALDEVQRITPLGTGSGATGRYRVEGGSKRIPFRVELSQQDLESVRRAGRLIGSAVRGVLYAPEQRVWMALLRLATTDPGIWRPEDAEGTLTLEERILAYASRAQAARFGRVEQGPPWPLARGAHIFFPLRHLRDHLAARSPESIFACGEVTGAIRSMGGGEHGTLRFREGTYRVWMLPFMRSGAGGGT
jgi:hypothetical protein